MLSKLFNLIEDMWDEGGKFSLAAAIICVALLVSAYLTVFFMIVLCAIHPIMALLVIVVPALMLLRWVLNTCLEYKRKNNE